MSDGSEDGFGIGWDKHQHYAQENGRCGVTPLVLSWMIILVVAVTTPSISVVVIVPIASVVPAPPSP